MGWLDEFFVSGELCRRMICRTAVRPAMNQCNSSFEHAAVLFNEIAFVQREIRSRNSIIQLGHGMAPKINKQITVLTTRVCCVITKLRSFHLVHLSKRLLLLAWSRPLER